MEENLQEDEKCPACLATATYYLKSGDKNRNLSDELFSYYKCSSCEMIFMSPVPDNIGAYYAGGYQKIPMNFTDFINTANKEVYRLDSLLRHKSKGELLEIGPWIGIFSFNAKRQGFSVDAIEMNSAACSFLRNEVKINVNETNNVVDSLNKNSKLYDVIVLWHSLEHLPEPWNVIKAARQRLKDGGLLIVGIPNISGGQGRFLGNKWLHLDAPRHITFWSPDALSKLAAASDLSVVEITTHDRLSQELEVAAWRHAICSIIPIRYVRVAIAMVIAPILAVISSRKGGAGITAIFRPNSSVEN